MYYQVGGSLAINAPCYIPRPSDTQLYQALKDGDFCYVLNARQMGKSSLMVRTRSRLQQDNDPGTSRTRQHCVVVDMSNIGSETITPLQWYKGVIKDLFRGFKLRRKVDFDPWWESTADLSLLQRLSRFIEDILLEQFPNDHLFIFIDEIDSILSLPFPVDDFFALIRYCYNQRAINPAYHRIRFAIFGVATPSDLIRDRQRTPFNIGTPIPLSGFTLDQCHPLLNGLDLPNCNTTNILREILTWTNGQPFLTQKLCQLVVTASEDTVSHQLVIPPGQEGYWVRTLVQDQLLADWEYQDEPEHLRTIRNRLLNQPDRAGRLLGIYQRVLASVGGKGGSSSPPPLQGGVRGGKSTTDIRSKDCTESVRADHSPEQTELLLSGLVIKRQGELRVKNPIYAHVFNQAWVAEQLGNLRPYSQLLAAWTASNYTDESWLLRGNALKDAQRWSQGKQLSDVDYRFLAASVECDRRQVQQSLAAERAQAVDAQLAEERKSAQIQRRSLRMVSVGLVTASVFSAIAFWQYRSALEREYAARFSTIQALASSAQGKFESHRHLDALVQAVQAQEDLAHVQKERPGDIQLTQQVEQGLWQVVYGTEEANRITTQTGIREVAIAPDNSFMAAAGADGAIYQWSPSGKQRDPIPNAHTTEINTIAISPDSQWIASGSADKTVKLWRRNGHRDGPQNRQLYRTLKHDKGINKVLFTRDGHPVSLGGGTVQLWTLTGELLGQWDGSVAIAVSPHNNTLALVKPPSPSDPPSDSQETISAIALYQLDGILDGHGLDGHGLNGDNLDEHGQNTAPTVAPTTTVPVPVVPTRMAFSPDGRYLAFTDRNHQLHIWTVNQEGQIQAGPTVTAHDVLIRNIAISADSQFITTASADNTVKLWDMEGTLLRTFEGHQAVVWHAVFSPEGDRILSAADDGTLRFWQWQNPWLTRLSTQGRRTRRVAFSVDGQTLAAGSQQGAVLMWDKHGTLNRRVPVSGAAYNVALSPDGQVAAGTRNGNVLIWDDRGQDESVLSLDHGPGIVWGVAFSPDGQWIASASEDSTVKLWARDGTLVQTLTEHTESMRDVAFSPDSRILASSSTDGTINLWAIDPSHHADPRVRLRQTFTNQQGSIRGLAFSPDRRYLASGTVSNSINIWDVEEDTEGANAPAFVISGFQRDGDQGHWGAIWDVAFSPDAALLASASMDGTVKLWAMPEAIAPKTTTTASSPAPLQPDLVRTLTGHDGPVRGVEFSPDGKAIASASDDKTVMLWHLDAILEHDALAYACEWLGNYWHHQLAVRATEASPAPTICGFEENELED